VAPIAEIATKGTRVAVLLPVIVKDASETEKPEYEMDVSVIATWKEGVDVRGVRTHFYLQVRPFCTSQFPVLPFRSAEGKSNDNLIFGI